MAQQPNPAAAFVVAIAGWLVPGLGYWLIGQRARGTSIGVTVVLTFLAGILIAGIRVVDPPGYGQYGYKVQLVSRVIEQQMASGQSQRMLAVRRVDPTSPAEEAAPGGNNEQSVGWALAQHPLAELGQKPWFVGQILAGPVALVFSEASILAAHPADGAPGIEGIPQSHARSWEIGTLYTAVAGMLNLLAVIDSAHRAAEGTA